MNRVRRGLSCLAPPSPFHGQRLFGCSNAALPTRSAHWALYNPYFLSSDLILRGRCFSTHEDDYSPISLSIPREKIQLSFSRSSGPGGQNVNKVNTKVELRFNLDEADWIPDDIKDRLRLQRAGDLNKEGEMVITSSVHRTQGHNLSEAFRKLKRYLDEACVVPKERIATEIPDYAIEHRLKEKKRRSELKQNRQKPRWDDHQ